MHHKSVSMVVVLLLLSLVSSSNAGGLQEIEVGVGPNFGYLAYDNPMEIWDVGWAQGYSGGIYFEIPLINRIALVPSLRFSNLSNKIEFVDPDLVGEFKVNHKFISIPLLFRYGLKENMFFFDLGPEFSFFLSSEIQKDYFELGIPHTETDDISDVVDSYNIGACIRVGFKAAQWNIPIAVTASYHYGFKGVAAEDDVWSDWKTREIALGISYLFDLSN